MASVSLVCLPWHVHTAPSIQLGTLQALLQQAGITCASHHLYLDFVDTLCREQYLAIEDYQLIGDFWFMHAPGEWTFALPPVRAKNPRKDALLFQSGRSTRY